MDRSPYDEHADERRQCMDCGGTHTVAGQPCPLCGPPSQPDPEATRQGLLATAAMLRKRSYLTKDKAERAICIRDAQWHERRAAQLTGHKEVA